MFTGIVSHMGTFKGYRRGKQELALTSRPLLSLISRGESLAVNGVCLSLVRTERDLLLFNLSEETLQRTTLGDLHSGDELNLERPVTLSTLLSGHLVSGHIDETGKIIRIQEKPGGRRIDIQISPKNRPFLIAKGSIAVDGISLTVADLGPSQFSVEVIPVTLKETNLGLRRRGDRINLEYDIFGKYVYNWVRQNES